MTSSTAVFPFLRLPGHAQMTILRFTNLRVAGLLPIYDMRHSTIDGFRIHSSANRLSTELLLVSRGVREISLAILWGENQFVLLCDPGGALAFLQAQPLSSLHRIRHLDLQLAGEGEGGSLSWLGGWESLAAFIVVSLNTSQLHLGLDDGDMYSNLEGTQEELIQTLLNYRSIVRCFYRHFYGRSLASFHVYWCCFFWHEEECEKYVMGGSYDSLAQTGKIHYTKRRYYNPHEQRAGSEEAMKDRGMAKEVVDRALWAWDRDD